MASILTVLWHGLRDSFLMAWQVWWALVFGFLVSAVVQAWIPRERVEEALSGRGARSVARATGLGAASSSCSYAAVAIAKSLFQKGASGTSALAFQFASTNLVWELGLVVWVLVGWPFTLGEFAGGIVMIALMALLFRAFVSPELEKRARDHAGGADTGHQHHTAGEQMTWHQRLTSASAWSDVAHNFRGDWQMLWKEITVGVLLAGFAAQLDNGVFHAMFLTGTPGIVQTLWGAFIGPVIAVLTFVCSVGNVPLAAVLWSGGISFAGVMAFIFADLIVLPIFAIYRKYYGVAYAARITLLMFVTMVVAALVVDGVFSAVGFVPTGARPTRTDVFSMLAINYKLVLNVAAGLAFTLLFGLTVRRGATDPVCGMKVDRAKALTERHAGRTYVFCSDHCRRRFIAARAGGRKTTPAAIASLRSPHPSAGGSQSNGRRGGTADDGGDRRRLRRLSHRGTL